MCAHTATETHWHTQIAVERCQQTCEIGADRVSRWQMSSETNLSRRTANKHPILHLHFVCGSSNDHNAPQRQAKPPKQHTIAIVSHIEYTLPEQQHYALIAQMRRAIDFSLKYI